MKKEAEADEVDMEVGGGGDNENHTNNVKQEVNEEEMKEEPASD